MYQIKKHCVFIALVGNVVLSGCAGNTVPTQTATEAALQVELAEWKKMKPGVQRLVAIESELKVLLQTLETVATNPTDQLETADAGSNVQSYVLEPVSFNDKKLTPPAGILPAEAVRTESATPAPASATMIAKSEKVMPPSEPEVQAEPEITSAPAPQPSRNFSLQLASVTAQDSLESTWQRLQQRYPDQLSDLDFHSEEVIVSNRTYFRVKAGSFDNYDEAKRQCAVLRKSGASCIVNKG